MLKSLRNQAGLWLLFWLVIAVPATPLSAKDLNLYDGQIVPRDYIAFCAPQNTLNLPFWGSSSNGIQLTSIEPEGKKVKAGDTLAVFQFRMEGAKDHLDRQFPQIKASNEEHLLRLQKAIDKLRQDLERMTIKTQQASLDLQKKSHLSLIRQKILDCDYNLLSFETRALEYQLKASIENLAILKSYFEKTEKIWKFYFEIFDVTKARYTVKTPEDGYLFYPVLDQQNRKVRAGDRFNSGVHFLSLGTSEKSELIFYLPEKDFQKAKPGDTVFIDLAPESDVAAKIREIGFFPQLIGDVMRNFRLPNAWDKCFIVKAEIMGDLRASSIGNVKVRLGE